MNHHEIIKKLRKEKKVTQSDLERSTGISRFRQTRIEAGEGSFKDVEAILGALGFELQLVLKLGGNSPSEGGGEPSGSV